MVSILTGFCRKLPIFKSTWPKNDPCIFFEIYLLVLFVFVFFLTEVYLLDTLLAPCRKDIGPRALQEMTKMTEIYVNY